jgi:hypothetical protein
MGWTLSSFAVRVRECRRLQRKYYRCRSFVTAERRAELLAEAVRAEHELDAALREILDARPLFERND